jgi:hypothetical protein
VHSRVTLTSQPGWESSVSSCAAQWAAAQWSRQL